MIEKDDALLLLAAGVTSAPPPEGDYPPAEYQGSHPPRPVDIPESYCVTFAKANPAEHGSPRAKMWVAIRDAEAYLHESDDEEGAVKMLEAADIERGIIDAIFIRRLEIHKARAYNWVAAFRKAAWHEATWRAEVAKHTLKALGLDR